MFHSLIVVVVGVLAKIKKAWHVAAQGREHGSHSIEKASERRHREVNLGVVAAGLIAVAVPVVVFAFSEIRVHWLSFFRPRLGLGTDCWRPLAHSNFPPFLTRRLV